MLVALMLASVSTVADRSTEAAVFSRHWNDNRAELSAYRLVQPRYNQPRPGEAVMIWVVEPFSLKKAVKVDAPGKSPAGDVVQVMKLNHLRDFQTGIYPYRLMTSVFLPTVPSKGDAAASGPLKIAFSSQEWCGTVFHQVVRSGDEWRSTWHSYFEQEGEGSATFASSEDLLFDDELWWRVREHVQPLSPGTYRYLPSLAAVRLAHVQMVAGRVVVARSDKAERIKVPAGEFETTRWTLDLRWGPDGTQRQKRTIWVERAFPRRIIAWEGTVASFSANEPVPERAELLGSIRDTYWQHNRLGDEQLRAKLGLGR